jgi:hypothetical protein
LTPRRVDEVWSVVDEAEREHARRDPSSRARPAVDAPDLRALVAPDAPAFAEVRGGIV